MNNWFSSRKHKAAIKKYEKAFLRKFTRAKIFGREDCPVCDDLERWKWAVPDDGKWHIDPKWPALEIKVGHESHDDGIRIGLFRTLDTDVKFGYHGHPDALELGVVAKGAIGLVRDGGVVNEFVDEGVFIVEPGVRHDAVSLAGTYFVLFYFRKPDMNC